MSLLDIVGQDHAILRLERARRAHRLGHGYIFHGPEGIGKGLVARQWAKLQLCASPIERPWPAGRPVLGAWTVAAAAEDPSAPPAITQTPETAVMDSCGTCGECRLVEAATHPDLHIINRQLGRYSSVSRTRQLVELPIDVIREFVIAPAASCPAHGRGRVFIIEQAETMNRAAQNALLKTLEEPPSQTFLVLLTSAPDMLLPTVRSRCQSIRMTPVPKSFVYNQLRQDGVEPPAACYLSDFTNGRVETALSLAGMGVFEQKRAILAKLARLGFGSALSLAQEVMAAAKAYGQQLGEDNPEMTAGDAERRGQVLWLEVLAHGFSQALRWTAGLGPDRASPPDGQPAGEMMPNGFDQEDVLAMLAQRWGEQGCADAIQATQRAATLVRANVNAALIFEGLMLEYTSFCATGRAGAASGPTIRK